MQPVVPQPHAQEAAAPEVVVPVVSSLAGRATSDPAPAWSPGGAAPFDAPPAPQPFGATTPDPLRNAAAHDDEDDVEDRPRHPYTWLHLIVLALVAFVLGFLIVLLLAHTSDGAAGDGSGKVGAAASITVVEPTT